MIISHSIIIEIKKDKIRKMKVVQKIMTHFMFNNFFFPLKIVPFKR